MDYYVDGNNKGCISLLLIAYLSNLIFGFLWFYHVPFRHTRLDPQLVSLRLGCRELIHDSIRWTVLYRLQDQSFTYVRSSFSFHKYFCSYQMSFKFKLCPFLFIDIHNFCLVKVGFRDRQSEPTSNFSGLLNFLYVYGTQRWDLKD